MHMRMGWEAWRLGTHLKPCCTKVHIHAQVESLALDTHLAPLKGTEMVHRVGYNMQSSLSWKMLGFWDTAN